MSSYVLDIVPGHICISTPGFDYRRCNLRPTVSYGTQFPVPKIAEGKAVTGDSEYCCNGL